MPVLTLYFATLIPFLALDALMLRFVMQPLFARHIGALLADPIRWAPAAVFYAAYIAGLIWLISWPALKAGGGVWVSAAVLGFMAYGTYEFTSYAIMRDWHWSMVAVDLTWGTVLTATSAAIGVAVTKALT
mgnify:CR=1 FL=1